MSTIAHSEAADEQSPKHRPTWQRYIKDFLEYTTAHGCGRLAASKGIFWKIFWIILVISTHGLFWYNTGVIVKEYLRRPVRTKVTMQRNKLIDFPVITLCNRNMLRQSKLTDKLKVQVRNARNETTEIWEKRNRQWRKYTPQVADSDLLHFMYHRSEVMRQIVSKEEPEDLRKMGHQLKDMVLDCMFDGEDCSREPNSKRVWHHLWIEDVGNCYMFNRVLPGDSVKSHQTMLTGDQHGLRLLINIEQYEYLQGISPYAGIKVVIGTQGEMPFPLNEGINVGPGVSTSIEIVMRQSLRLDPFNNKSCDRVGKLDPSNIYHQYNMTYSKMACRMSCLSKLQEQNCNCSQFHFTDNPNIGYCVTADQSTGDCVDRVESIFQKGACEEGCPPRCLDTEFSRMVSTYKWPANRFKTTLNKSVRRLANLSLQSHEEISDNLLELHIYYADMDYELVEETLKYEFQDLISNIGGQMGIWIGVSALTIAEVLELVWIVVAAVSRKKNDSNGSKEH